MKKIFLKTILILISLIFLLQIKVQAAVIVSTDKQVESGSGNVTISVTSKQALGAYKLRVTDTAGLELVNSAGGEISSDKKTITGSSASGITNLGTYTFKVPTVTKDTTYNIKFSITGMETVNLETVTDETNIAKVVVKASVVTTPAPEPTTPTPVPKPETPPATVTKSSEARLSNLGITPNDFSGFKRDKYEYSTTVPNDIAEVEVYANPFGKNVKIEGTGKVSLKEGDNTVKVKVTAEDETTTKTYTLTIKRKTAEEQAKEDGEARLKSLGIKPEEHDFTGFNSEKTEYSVEVPNEVEEIEVYATAMKSTAQITGTGMISLKEGLNELKIESIAADGTKKTYILNVTRKEAEETTGTTDTFGLSILTVQGLSLSPKFDTSIYEYTIELNEDLSSLQIGTRPTLDEATVEIIGNENLQDGENIITILVKNEETEESATYQITVNKNIIVEEVEEQMSWLKPATWGKEEIIKIAIILVLIILIIIAIILKINIAKENDKINKVGLPGAEELDKAIAEHQELSEENNPQIEQNYIEEIAISKSGMDEGNEGSESKVKRRGRHF